MCRTHKKKCWTFVCEVKIEQKETSLIGQEMPEPLGHWDIKCMQKMPDTRMQNMSL